jgi:hypothetical protein
MVELQSIVKDSFLCSHSHVEIHGKVLSSVLGPGSSVAEGEVTSSLMGPMVGFHHQSLLIASFWPAGRGNVGYGANVGSNHTSRLSDQSLWPGEGIFFGLGSSSKFPLNLSEAPYSIVATGVVWGPGRLNVPFSLITEGSRIAPGWSIVSNTYQLERAFVKGKSRAHLKGYAAQPIRMSTMNLVWSALQRLKSLLVLVKKNNTAVDKKITESIHGLVYLASGYTTIPDIEKGIRAYEFVLELYALRTCWEIFHGNFNQVIQHVAKHRTTTTTGLSWSEGILNSIIFDPADTGLELLEAAAMEANRDYACAMLYEMILKKNQSNVIIIITHEFLMDLYQQHEQKWYELVYESKRRDHDRGSIVFPPGKYDEGVIELNQDPVIISAKNRAQAIVVAVVNGGKL